MQFFEQGLAVLRKLISEESIGEINFAYAKELAEANQKLETQNLLSKLLLESSSYLCLTDPAPRDKETTKDWSEKINKYDSYDIKSYINDIEEDPHYMQDLLSINQIARECGWDPFDRITTTKYKSEALIACATGYGMCLQQAIDYFKPKILTIAVSKWEEFVSSFGVINWVEIWNYYCVTDNCSITIISAEEPLSLLSRIAVINSYCLDHSFILTAPSSLPGTKKLESYLKTDMISRSLSYFGFAMDEYNMIWNSWQSLQASPKVFHYPSPRQLKGQYIVTGSGPSLNDSIPLLKEIQNNAIIVACASNYGTLRKNNINVDVLCLLERGDFMIDQYTENSHKYGIGTTKLFASCTTPHELHSLYKDAMVYFRPSLTPTGIFSNALYNILPNEGPQTINTGIAFAMSQYPESIILAGVDLGCTQQDNVRSDGAIGVSPREFDITVKGNFTEIAYTNGLLSDAKNVLESLAVACSIDPLFNQVDLVNTSNGIKIEGWISKSLESINLSSNHFEIKSSLDKFWDESVEYSVEQFFSSFKMSQPRKRLLESITQLLDLASITNTDNFYDNSIKFVKILALNDKDYHSTIGLRMIRGNITRLLSCINRQMIIQSGASKLEKDLFIQMTMKYLSSTLKKFQHEIFSLFDHLEASSLTK